MLSLTCECYWYGNMYLEMSQFYLIYVEALEDGADLLNEKEEYAWLAEVKSPDIYMRQGRYLGPVIHP